LALPLVACSLVSNPLPTLQAAVTPSPLGPEAGPTHTPISSLTHTPILPPPTDTPLPPATPTPAPPIIAPPDPFCCTLTPIARGLIRPTYLTHAGDDRLFILEQRGLIDVLVDGQMQTFLDLQPLVGSRANEQGLLGLAFHPNYATNGLFFINYTDKNGDTVVARYTVSADPNRADPDSAKTLFHVEQPYPNHNGGNLAFGPEGLLYIGLGDGGSAGDPAGNGQNPETPLGKMLRLNVDIDGAQPEIWATGLRNPWRYSFDRLTGALFIGDVGQGDWEEIDFVPAPLPGAGPNFGWNILEGTHRYSTFGDVTGLTGPIAEYSHSEGGCSVTGGYVYRGAALPALQGNYFFSDYCSGIIWSLTPNSQGQWDSAVFMETGYNISSFGEDARGELYVVDHAGAIYRLIGE
ncbi:MAG TPA: PQQ-dependent sugar dehydrogenase, partial [Anaerolineales bacterium]|nr:PQQ-dependent sugar dehydrogenase [Anaerolineales bacterium]